MVANFFKKNSLSLESYGEKMHKDHEVIFQISNCYMFEYDSSVPGIVKTSLHQWNGQQQFQINIISWKNAQVAY
jgi:hypothetical protein